MTEPRPDEDLDELLDEQEIMVRQYTVWLRDIIGPAIDESRARYIALQLYYRMKKMLDARGFTEKDIAPHE